MTSQQTINKQVNALMDRFLKGYEAKWKTPAQFNRFKFKWGFQDMLSDLGYEMSQEVIDHFLSLKIANHSAQTLLYNYDRYAKVLQERERDREERHALRKKTEQAVREMEEHGNRRGGSS